MKKNAKVKSLPNIEDANELEDILPELWEEGVDAVKIGNWADKFSEQEIAILNPRSIVKGSGENFQVFQKDHKGLLEYINQEALLLQCLKLFLEFLIF